MRHLRHSVFIACGLLAGIRLIAAAQVPSPGGAGLVRPARVDLSQIDRLVMEAIGRRELPGAVVLIGRGDETVYEKAFGNRALVPATEPMTLDTIFDLASLTKVVATTTAIMMLVEEGRIGLNDPVARFIPEFGRYGKERVTIRHLLTHMSGLRPDLDLEAEFSGYQTAISRAADETLESQPGDRFVYSDINFFLLGDIVARVSGESLEEFARVRIFEPLGMRDTMFRPPASLTNRIAPTESCSPLGWPCGTPGGQMLRGVVHDPTARRMGGVAGHAGLFGTATDLAIFCRLLIGGGTLGPVRLLSPLTVAKMTSVATPAESSQARGLGWDIDSRFSMNRGDLFPFGSYGHTGFTGTSLWIDSATRVFVVFLSNRVHPDGKGDVTALRGRVATAAAAALVDRLPDSGLHTHTRWTGSDFGAVSTTGATTLNSVSTGIDVLEDEAFASLKGKRIALLTNRAGRSSAGVSSIELLRGAPDVRLVSLLSPEHGLDALLDEGVPSRHDERTGLRVHSLYGDTRRPTAEILTGLDAVVVDLQDIGTRFYTFATTMAYVMEEAARRQVSVIVLDRPNPINGIDVEGPLPDSSSLGFTAYVSMPIRHGLTIGELARLFNGEKKIGAELTVVPMKNWHRDEWFDETGVAWTNPSPNMRSVVQAALYPGIGAFEGTNISVGRGTDAPFEQVGAPWIDGVRLAHVLNDRKLPGVGFYPQSFTPAAGAKFGGEVCGGVRLLVKDRSIVRPVRVGLEIAAAILRLYGSRFELEKAMTLFGSREGLARLRRGEDPETIARSWATEEARWRSIRAPYLLYH